jgi:hypothetical protein
MRADFQLNTRYPGGYNNAIVNLVSGTYAQVLGMTQNGAYVQGCQADDLTANNSPVYLNWWNTVGACQQAFIAELRAGI